MERSPQLKYEKERGNQMISAVLSVVIVNIAYKLYAKLIGADVMFFSGKKKLAAYVVLWALLFATTGI